jgi:deazaflavin-dependent oxidoreductase (nitroreductase family)
MGGSRMLALTTRGRKSQKPHHTLLSFVTVDEKVYVCSGWGEKSDWYKNLKVDPRVILQIGNITQYADAYRITDPDEFSRITEEMFETGGDSHFEPWLESFGIEFTREDMIAKQDRLHIIGFRISAHEGLPALSTDLIWIWGLLLLFIGGLIWLVI